MRFTLRTALAAIIFSAVAAASAGCASLEDVPANVCGNGVVEANNGEDCDPGNVSSDAGTVETCGEANAANACRISCKDGPCPAGYACAALTHACVGPPVDFTRAVRFGDGIAAMNLSVTDTDGDGAAETVATYNPENSGRYYLQLPRDRVLAASIAQRVPEWPAPPVSTASIDPPSAAKDPRGRSVFMALAGGVSLLHYAPTLTVQPDARFGTVDVEASLGAATFTDKTRVVHLHRTFGRKGRVRDGLAAVTDIGGSLGLVAAWVAPDPADSSAPIEDANSVVVEKACTTGRGFYRPLGPHKLDQVTFVGGANVVETAPRDCEEAVVIFKDNEVRTFESCTRNACPLKDDAVVERQMRLIPPSNAATLGEAAAADVDGDGHVDLVAAWTSAAAGANARLKTFTLQRGNGDGTFAPPLTFQLHVVNGQSLNEDALGLTVFRERRDVDGVEGGRTFAIIKDRVLRIEANPRPPDADTPSAPFSLDALQVTWPTGAPRWDNPIAEDVDGDGITDVVLTSNNRIDVLRGNGLGAFGTSLVEVGTPIHATALGDFDGDGLLDLAVSHEVFTSSSSKPVSIDVAYGIGAARFSPLLPLLSLSNADAKLVSRRVPSFNGADALVAVTVDANGTSPLLVALVGDGTQGGLLPTAEVRCSPTTSALAPDGFRLSVNAGAVVQHTENSVLRSIMLVSGLGDLSDEDANRRSTFRGFAIADITDGTTALSSANCVDSSSTATSVHLTSADVCDDGFDEFISIGVDADGRPSVSLRSIPVGPLASPTSLSFTPLTNSFAAAAKDIKPATVRAIPRDLDGDGDVDILVRIANEARVFWNESTSSQSTCSAAQFREATLPFTGDDGGRIKGIAVLSQGLAAPARIIAITGAGFVQFAIDKDEGVVRRPLDLVDKDGTALFGLPTALETGDVDGDGIDDLIVADAVGLRVHYGVERTRKSK